MTTPIPRHTNRNPCANAKPLSVANLSIPLIGEKFNDLNLVSALLASWAPRRVSDRLDLKIFQQQRCALLQEPHRHQQSLFVLSPHDHAFHSREGT